MRTAHGLTVVREDPAARSVVLSGTIEQFQNAFGVKLEHYEHHSAGQFRGRTGTISVPDDLHGVVEAVLGLDNRPQARPHFRIRPPFQPAKGRQVSFTPPQLASLYQFPQGDGRASASASSNWAAAITRPISESYFASLGVASPTVKAVGVDQGSNQPSGDPNGPDGEVTLDIEIVGCDCAGREHRGVFHAEQRRRFHRRREPRGARHDQQALGHFDQLGRPGVELDQPVAQGLQQRVAVGGGGGRDGLRGVGRQRLERRFGQRRSGRLSGVESLCAGVRRHEPDARRAPSISHEVVWNDGAQGGASGGGVSRAFPVPVWQNGLSATSASGGKTALSGRGVPDVAGDASPVTGYSVLIDGTQTVVGGTSAVAPLWAALIARINAAKGQPAGFINPKLYKAPAACERHHAGQQRQFRGGAGLGRLHGTRQSQWSESGGRTIVCNSLPEEGPFGSIEESPKKSSLQDVNEPMERS